MPNRGVLALMGGEKSGNLQISGVCSDILRKAMLPAGHECLIPNSQNAANFGKRRRFAKNALGGQTCFRHKILIDN
jgi:hypothetical protein